MQHRQDENLPYSLSFWCQVETSKIFAKERDMQDWLVERLRRDNQGFGELIINPDYLTTVEPTTHADTRFLESYRRAMDALDAVEVLVVNQNIATDERDKLQPDLVLYDQYKGAIVVVELKNRRAATREAGTELGAYAAAVRTYVPFIAAADVVSVIISSEWPTLLRRFVFNEIVWFGRTVICLEPALGPDEAVSLSIKKIDAFTGRNATKAISASDLTGHILSLKPPQAGFPRTHVAQMRLAGMAMTRRGISLGSNGFAFLWKTNNTDAPYSFTLVDVSPMRDLFHLCDSAPPHKGINAFHLALIKTKNMWGTPDLSRSLTEIREHAKSFLKSCCHTHLEGAMNWQDLLEDMLDNRTRFIGFYAWGVFGDAYHLKLAEKAARSGSTVHDSVEVGWETISELVIDDAD
ncbi:hypothetical protein RAS12_24035 [Achromobacter seleniivolatilans]|uniref:Uncharacterized protein n=1 Tax=Achromobacter seleniivolatilans TaxID=3047478 RepID=A0ABY9LYW5_9BURK|nr:hypothetical protein [Achromobacter sp. R39]WMD19660.1 hypothetical protein RAS12_24035 [Achromobacter sp. R39]